MSNIFKEKIETGPQVVPNRSLTFKLFVRAITFILILLSYVKCKNVIIMGK